MRIDAIVAEIGSTTTVINAFDGLNTSSPKFIGQGRALTTVLDGDVRIGLNNAIEDLKRNLNVSSLTYETMLASGSAAGGLRMSVHGLVRDMTVRAAEAAALGAGAIPILTTAGKLTEYDLDDLETERPNLILLAGGTDMGERETAIYNLNAIASRHLKIPIVYCGNKQNRSTVERICKQSSIPLELAENVYPKLDTLNVEPVRKCIHRMFEEHIIQAPGMEHIRELVNSTILPTPGSVMLAAKLLAEELGELCVLDIGGATTDVHSVAEGSEEIARMMVAPEPIAKRTVEGDLGLYLNAKTLVERLDAEKLSKELGFSVPDVMEAYRPIPETAEQFCLTERLCFEAGKIAIERHAGQLRHLYTPQGRRTIAEGKDLSTIQYLIGTGGALTRLPNRAKILRSLADMNPNRMRLFPRPGAVRILIDTDYIMASCGALSTVDEKSALSLMKESLTCPVLD